MDSSNLETIRKELQQYRIQHPIKAKLRDMYLEVYCLLINNNLMRKIKKI